MKLFVVFCIFVTMDYVCAERDLREAVDEMTEWIKGIQNADMTGPIIVREAYSRQRRNVCQRNWFLRMVYGDNFTCKSNCLDDKSNGTTWRGGKCLNGRCVCY